MFGNEIHAARLYCAKTQKQIAKEAGISMRSLQMIEHGQSIPCADIIAKLADCLGLDLAEMLAIAGNESRGHNEWNEKHKEDKNGKLGK